MTFLFSDIEGSTRRWAEDPEMSEALTRHDAILRASIESSGGQWVKHTGDGVFAVFGNASDAVTAAIDIQRAIHRDFEGSLRVRIGLHTGEAERRGDDVFGLAVSTAARIMDVGHGGQIMVSEATRAVLGSGPQDEFELLDLGTHRLKDLSETQRLYQVIAPGLDSDFPALRTLEAVDHNLPLQLTSFVGRERELEEVADLVRTHRLVTVTGVGGAGKTRLTLQVAAELAETFPEGAWLVELAVVNDPDGVAAAFAAALGVRHEKGGAVGVLDRLVDHLRGRELLLVVDNCEHVLGATGSLLQVILSAAPDVTVLASSREGLGIAGERLWQLPSLDVGAGVESEASRLFMDRAETGGSRLEWNEETRRHVVRICELLDGIPLAIELAAARTRVLSPEQISLRLSDRFRLLTGGARSALPRQQTMEAAVDWSYQLLSETERRLFSRLAVFVGGFSLEAVEAVCADDDVEESEILDLLAALVDKSMVLVDRTASGASRYRLLETLRQFGLRRLLDQGEMEIWKARHLDYHVELLEDRYCIGWHVQTHLPWYAVEHGNLSAALEWASSDSGHAVQLLASALTLHQYFNLGDPDAALQLSQVAIGAVDGSGLALRLGALQLFMLERLGRIEDLRAAWERLEPHVSDAEDADAAWCLVRASSVHAWDPELDVTRAMALAREAVRRSEGLGPEARFSTQMSLAIALSWSDVHPGEILPIHRTAIDLAKQLGDPARVMFGLTSLIMTTMTLDEREGTDLTTAVEDELLSTWEGDGQVDTRGVDRVDGHPAGNVGSRRGRTHAPRGRVPWRHEGADAHAAIGVPLDAGSFRRGRPGSGRGSPAWAHTSVASRLLPGQGGDRRSEERPGSRGRVGQTTLRGPHGIRRGGDADRHPTGDGDGRSRQERYRRRPFGRAPDAIHPGPAP
jgi:predicted ATPase/class 3 adenylate cyclase